VTLALPVQSVQALSFTFTVPNGTLNGAPITKPVSASATFTTSGADQLRLEESPIRNHAPNQLLQGYFFNQQSNESSPIWSYLRLLAQRLSLTMMYCPLNHSNADLLQEWSLITPTSNDSTLGSGQPDDMIIGQPRVIFRAYETRLKCKLSKPFIDNLLTCVGF